jgi:diguanylate cyclase (GGDEF)-like protein/excisionase family DNA binding protein
MARAPGYAALRHLHISSFSSASKDCPSGMTTRLSRPLDATLSVTRAARLLGVHPNTIRAWSDAGRLRYFRINLRGDRRFRLGDLQHFMNAAEATEGDGHRSLTSAAAERRTDGPGRRTLTAGRRGHTPGAAPAPADRRMTGPGRRGNDPRLEAWAAQLRSIQHLGARLNRLTRVEDIGRAIVGELGLLIEYDNVRVYHRRDDQLIPVALDGRVHEYADETTSLLRVAVGEGITGWVAAHKVAQNLPDTAHDPRAWTIPGTSPDLEESMILAPIAYDDNVVGVLALSKLGLRQFSDDDLRLLEIYASFAAQAFSNAEITQQLESKSAALERQLRSQRDLLSITESILTTLDPQRVLEQVADRLGDLVGYDNLAIEVVESGSGELRPLTVRGTHAGRLLRSDDERTVGIADWVTRHRQAVLVLDERDDPRISHVHDTEVEGSLIAVPLRGGSGPGGIVILERLGRDNVYSKGEFELVQLFAAQVSIALQNAEAHRAVEIRAASDDLTGLFNHGTFQERLEARVRAGETFSLIMLDLDVFKNVNDAMGHQAGDRLLGEIARALETASRDTDGIFRYGGDEFTVILPHTDGAKAQVVADRILTTICALSAAGSPWHQRAVQISASLGVATFPDNGATAADILLAADRACQVSKRNGRARVSSAADGLALATEFTLKQPTPVDRVDD